MFETYLSNALVERFGKYIDGLDIDNLQVPVNRIRSLLRWRLSLESRAHLIRSRHGRAKYAWKA